MKKIVVAVSPIREGESVDYKLLTQEFKNSAWTNKENVDLTANSLVGESRSFILADNERLVVEGRGSVEVVFNKEQNAAVPVVRQESETRAQAETRVNEEARVLADTALQEVQERQQAEQDAARAAAQQSVVEQQRSVEAAEAKPSPVVVTQAVKNSDSGQGAIDSKVAKKTFGE